MGLGLESPPGTCKMGLDVPGASCDFTWRSLHPFALFPFGFPVLKPNSRKTRTLILQGTLENLVNSVSRGRVIAVRHPFLRFGSHPTVKH